jgi:hypothetical protein
LTRQQAVIHIRAAEDAESEFWHLARRKLMTAAVPRQRTMRWLAAQF